jgi:AcrR family transcriptional regulator
MTPDRRRRLLEAAAREFSVAGYERASLNRIISICGLSKSSFYHFVSGKAHLFDLVLADVGRELTAAAQIPSPADLAGPHFWDAIERLVLRLASLSEQDEFFADVGRLFYLPGVPRSADGEIVRAEIAVEEWLTAALEAGRACRAVRTDMPVSLQDSLALAVLRACDEWVLAQPAPDSADLAALARRLVAMLRRMLAPDASQRPG